MNQTLTAKTETVQNTEQALHTVESRVPETVSGSINEIPNTPKQVEIDDFQASGGAQVIQEERQGGLLPQKLDNRPLDSELSYIATLQRERLGNELPSAGYGSENLPFAK
jgi:hypothetical protein